MAEALTFIVDGMTCGACSARVEKALSKVEGVRLAHVNLAAGTARVEGDALQNETLIKAMARVGYEARPFVAAQPRSSDAEGEGLQGKFLWALALTVPLFILEMGGHLVPAFHHFLHGLMGEPMLWLIQAVLAAGVLFGPGFGIIRKGAVALWRFAPDMNALVFLGAGAAFLYSSVVLVWPESLPLEARHVYFEAAAVIVTLILLGRWLEARAKGRTGEAIRQLLALRPSTALRQSGQGEEEVPLEQIVVGDVLIIKAGERIPLDGLIVVGESHVDESMLTGEPLPQRRGTGDGLTGGTINGEGLLQMKVTATGEATVLSHIVAMVEEAQGARLPVQDLVSKITLWFVPVIIAVACLTALVWWFVGPEPRISHALVAAVTVLIVACPCAMGLAVPTSIMVGTGRAAELGVLFRKGDALQRLAEVKTLAADKTGTLTLGRPVLSDFTGSDETFRLAAAVEAYSDHPAAKALLAESKRRGVVLPEVRDMKTLAGQGVTGCVEGRFVAVGNGRLMAGLGVKGKELLQGGIMIAVEGEVVGAFTVADQLRPEAKAVVAALQLEGIEVVMITGDAQQTAAQMATELGIEKFYAEVPPEGKKAIVEGLKAKAVTAFLGDGINDAAALASADVGLAIGAGTDVAIESADVVLMGTDLQGAMRAIALSRATLRNIRQNLLWAFGYNVLLIPVAAGLLYPLWEIRMAPAMAAAAMALSSVFVVGNALRLRRAGDHI